jgi:Holliday junction resolvase RusA-like endonuclease
VFCFTVYTDPVGLSVNKRYLSNGTIHKEVRAEMQKVKDAAKAAAEAKRFKLQPFSYLRVTFTFTFRTFRPDLDNPIKRTLDATAEALGFNDSRVYELHVYRGVGGEQIDVEIEELEDYEVDIPAGMKRPQQEAVWVG